jgi:hypothetical protein
MGLLGVAKANTAVVSPETFLLVLHQHIRNVNAAVPAPLSTDHIPQC